ncbi:MAG: RnfABCDGE type electron transport complex subunit G [Candidatus Omnitrophota bacterium]
MKEMARYGITLAVICVAASASLAIVNKITSPRIIAQAQAEEQSSLKEVMPQAESFLAVKPKEEVLYYKALDKQGKFLGVVFKAAAKGYSSVIETIAGMTKQGVITDIKVISQNETPGLGARVTENSFTDSFKNKPIEVMGEIQAITGATISSQAVIEAVKTKAAEIKELIKYEP